MTAKEPKKVAGVAEAQELAYKTEIECLKKDLKSATDEIDHLAKVNHSLQGKLDSAKQPTECMRNKLLIALAPNIDINHARSEAMRVKSAADEILKVWGI